MKIILGNIFSMSFQARYHDITPVIGLPLPIDIESAQKTAFSPPHQGYARLVERFTDLDDKIKTTAADSEIPVVDLHQLFLKDDQKADSTYLLLPKPTSETTISLFRITPRKTQKMLT